MTVGVKMEDQCGEVAARCSAFENARHQRA
jgi:hypothetical protein